MPRLPRFTPLIAGPLLLLALLAPVHQAAARVFVGVGIPLFAPPLYYPPPVYYPPPPTYYAPPVQYAPPPAYNAAPAGQSCYAGAYTCPMDRPVVSGSACYCPGNGGARVWGHAN
jgi:hypothetical protein